MNVFQKLFPCRFNNPKCKNNFWGCRCGVIGTTAAIVGGVLGAGAIAAGAMQSREATQQAQQQADIQQEQWQQMSEPQKEYMRQMYPLQLEMMQEYVPYYKDVLTAQKELLPYSQKALTEQYYPMYGKTYEDILAYGAEGAQPWEREAISVPFGQARTQLGERAAGAGTLRAGATQKLATLYDIAEAEALTQLPYQRKQEALAKQMQFLGYTPTTPAVTTPGQIGVSIPAQPAPYQPPTPEGMDWGSIGKLIGMGLSLGGGGGSSFDPSQGGSAVWV